MKLSILVFLTLTIQLAGRAQEFNLNKIRFKSFGMMVEKATIMEAFGIPKIQYPEYECGFYSNDQPGAPFYQLVYEDFNYIGRDNERFLLEEVRFDRAGSITMVYDGVTISGKTTESAFATLIGDHRKERFVKQQDHTVVLLLSQDSDDGACFTFKNGKLVKFEYWSPC